MKTQMLHIFGAVALLAASLPALKAADFQIIASKDVTVDEISTADLERIFTLSKTSLPGTPHVVPVLQKGGPAHQAFLKECIGKSEAELEEIYKGLVFTGKASEPKSLASDAAVISFVALSKGTIAYVSGSAIPMGVKKLTVK